MGQVRAAARLARLGCDAYAYAMVALGTLDLVVEAGLKCWDVEAAVPVIEGAGGLVTDWRGERIGRNGGQMAIAGDRACLDEALVARGKGAIRPLPPRNRRDLPRQGVELAPEHRAYSSVSFSISWKAPGAST